jgi:hypothetical protein
VLVPWSRIVAHSDLATTSPSTSRLGRTCLTRWHTAGAAALTFHQGARRHVGYTGLLWVELYHTLLDDCTPAWHTLLWLIFFVATLTMSFGHHASSLELNSSSSSKSKRVSWELLGSPPLSKLKAPLTCLKLRGLSSSL